MSIGETNSGETAGLEARSFDPEAGTRRARRAVGEAARQAKAAATTAKVQASAAYDEAVVRAKAAQQAVSAFVDERPYSALAAAAFIGLVAGALFFASGPRIYYLKPAKD